MAGLYAAVVGLALGGLVVAFWGDTLARKVDAVGRSFAALAQPAKPARGKRPSRPRKARAPRQNG